LLRGWCCAPCACFVCVAQQHATFLPVPLPRRVQDDLRAQIEVLVRENNDLGRRNRKLRKEAKKLRQKVREQDQEQIVLKQQLDRARGGKPDVVAPGPGQL